jgi:cell division septum initiation protein DivIVA
MAKFDINKKGYDTEQVDNFINKLSVKYEEKLSEQKDRVFALKNELAVMEERLNNYRDKDKQVSQALVFAVEKAEQIESNASKLYDLEVKRLRLLYKQWQEIISKIMLSNVSSAIVKELQSFTITIGEVLEQNTRIGGNLVRKDLHRNSNDYIKNLLNRMDYAINVKPKQTVSTGKTVKSAMAVETEKENARMIDLSGKLDKIKVKGEGNMAENYLNSEEDMQSVFARTITRKKPKKNDNAFDMEDILNPKEDLDEIMKAFDFFLENQKDED